MTFVQALSAVYAVSGVAACAFYGPQLLRLVRDAGARRAMSAASWAGWLAVSLVAVLYGAVVTAQAEMVLVAGSNALCQLLVLALVVGQRWQDRRQTGSAPWNDKAGTRRRRRFLAECRDA